MKLTWPQRKSRASEYRVAVQKRGVKLVLSVGNHNSIHSIETLDCDDGQALVPLVRGFCQRHALNDVPATLVLDASSYQMLLVEAPPVAPEELAEALKWKVKDLLQGSVESSVVDGFLLPEDAYRGRQKMAYTVATDRSQLQTLVEQLKQAGLAVDRVEIPELVLLHMLSEHDMADQAEIVVLIGEQAGFMAVIVEQAIYLSRKLETNVAELTDIDNALRNDGSVDQLVLEIQRSRDYFESQMGKGAVNRLLLVPLNQDCTAIVQALGERLGLGVEMLRCDDLLTLETAGAGLESSELTHNCAENLLLAGAVQHAA